MSLITFFFVLYSSLFIFSSIMVIGSNNPIHSVFFLVLTFFNAAGLIILLEAEFMAMMFLIIYVGAIAVLFLFVVMMLNIKIIVSNFNLLRYLPLGGVISIILLLLLYSLFNGFDGISLFSMVKVEKFYLNLLELDWQNWFFYKNVLIQPEVIGSIMYTYSYDVFIVSGIILFIAMIGAILLTLSESNLKKQYISEQIERISYLNLVK